MGLGDERADGGYRESRLPIVSDGCPSCETSRMPVHTDRSPE